MDLRLKTPRTNDTPAKQLSYFCAGVYGERRSANAFQTLIELETCFLKTDPCQDLTSGADIATRRRANSKRKSVVTCCNELEVAALSL